MARQGYGKLSNGFHSNTKVLKLQRMRPSALGVYCMAISFCSDVLNDGVMSEDDVIYQLNATEEDIEALIKVGMFERSDDGSYRIHDYLSHQSSREQVETRAEGARNRKRKQRSEADVTPESRWDETNVTSMSRRDNSNVTPESRWDSLTKNQEPITNNQKNSSNEEFSLPKPPRKPRGPQRAPTRITPSSSSSSGRPIHARPANARPSRLGGRRDGKPTTRSCSPRPACMRRTRTVSPATRSPRRTGWTANTGTTTRCRPNPSRPHAPRHRRGTVRRPTRTRTRR